MTDNIGHQLLSAVYSHVLLLLYNADVAAGHLHHNDEVVS